MPRAYHEDQYNLLKHLSFPATASFHICIIGTLPSRASSTLPALYGLHSLHLDVRLSMSADAERQPFEIRAFREGESTPTLHIEVDRPNYPSCAWTQALSPLVDVSAVETYVLRFRHSDVSETANGYRPFIDSPQWPSVLAHLAALKTLCVCDAEYRWQVPLLEALRKTRGGGAAGLPGTEAALCPFLETLEIDGFICDENFWPALSLVVSTRHGLPGGGPLKTVRIKNPLRAFACDEEERSAMSEMSRRLQVLEVGSM